MSVSDYSQTPSDNNSLSGSTVSDATPVNAVDDLIRQIMADIAETPLSEVPSDMLNDLGVSPYIETLLGAEDADAARNILESSEESSEVLIADIDLTSGAAARYDIPAEFTSVELRVTEFQPTNNSGYLAVRLGTGGATGAFLSAGDSYFDASISISLSGQGGGVDAFSEMPLTVGNHTHSSWAGVGTAEIYGMNTAGVHPKLVMVSRGVDATPADQLILRGSRVRETVSADFAFNAVEIFVTNGSTNFTFTKLKATLVGRRNG